MNKFEYWFLDTAVEEVIGFSWIVPNEQYGDLGINRAPLNLTVAEITDVLHGLFQKGDLLAVTSSETPLYKLEDFINRGFIPSKSEIESAIHQKINLGYFLTIQGGEKWELFSQPNWNLYWTGYGNFLSGVDRKLLETYLALYHLIDHGNTRACIIPGTESWEILTPWQATYWKTLPIGYEVRYESRSVEFDESAKRDPKLIELEKQAKSWCDSTRIWYANYFKQCEAELNYSTALAKSPNLKIEYLMLKSAICGCESLINFAHSEQLSQAEVVLAADSLFQRGDIKAMMFTDEYDTEPASDVDGITNYTYDKNNQLTVADHSNSNKPNESFSYDGNGNRNSSGYQTGSNNRLNSDGKYNYAYDDEGNLTRRTEIASNKVTEYEWDYRNRLAGVVDKNAGGNVTQEVGFKYDSQNRRISKKVGGNETRFVYDRDNVLFDFAVSGANQPVLDKRYFYGTGVDQILAQESGTGGVLWALSDQLGTVKDWVNSSGSVANHVVYDSFGGVVSQSNSAFGSRYGFTGREFDGETGLYYYRSRYYNPGIGRFIGEDSVGFGGGDVNLYRYVGNNSINSIDPSGFLVWGVYNRGNKQLLLTDASQRSDPIIVNVFSGKDEAKDQPQLESVPDKGPIPKGRYEILEHTVQNWYRLDRLDSKPRNDKDDDLYGRGAFRLHPGTLSLGCITIPNDTEKGKDDWNKIKNMLDRTETEIVEDNLGRSAFLLSFIGRGPKLKKYGEIFVE